MDNSIPEERNRTQYCGPGVLCLLFVSATVAGSQPQKEVATRRGDGLNTSWRGFWKIWLSISFLAILNEGEWRGWENSSGCSPYFWAFSKGFTWSKLHFADTATFHPDFIQDFFSDDTYSGRKGFLPSHSQEVSLTHSVTPSPCFRSFPVFSRHNLKYKPIFIRFPKYPILGNHLLEECWREKAGWVRWPRTIMRHTGWLLVLFPQRGQCKGA